MSERRFRRSAAVIRRDVRDEMLLFDPRDDSMHVLNPAAALLWERLAQPALADELTAALAAAFEVLPGDDLAGDVAALLSDMEGRGLVVVDTVES